MYLISFALPLLTKMQTGWQRHNTQMQGLSAQLWFFDNLLHSDAPTMAIKIILGVFIPSKMINMQMFTMMYECICLYLRSIITGLSVNLCKVNGLTGENSHKNYINHSVRFDNLPLGLYEFIKYPLRDVCRKTYRKSKE